MDGEYYTVRTQIIVIIIYSVKHCSMHVLPFSHKDGVYKHDTDSTGHIEYQMVKKPNPDDVSTCTCAAAADSDTMHTQILNSFFLSWRLFQLLWNQVMLCYSTATLLTIHHQT